MQGDISLPPVPPPAPSLPPVSPTLPPPHPTHQQSQPPEQQPKKSRRTVWLLLSCLLVTLLIIGGAVGWGLWQLQPRDYEATQGRRVTIARGSSPSQIASLLNEQGIIRNAFIFRLYVLLKDKGPALRAGTYVVSPSQSVGDIVSHLTSGRVETMRVTIAPGQTLKQLKSSLIKRGFSAADIDTAYAAHYDNPLVAGRPAGTSLEGYIFPDTYEIESSDGVQQLFMAAFTNLQHKIEQENLAPAFQSHGLTVHQALTLASIIQKEDKRPEEQKQIAQVFLKRQSMGMALGSDVTFMYAADQLGVPPSIDIDSPYNTRKYVGLPPGPIGNFNLSALEAVANPAPGDYLFFVAGDDGTVYYSRTAAEHERNVAAHCSKLCQ